MLLARSVAGLAARSVRILRVRTAGVSRFGELRGDLPVAFPTSCSARIVLRVTRSHGLPRDRRRRCRTRLLLTPGVSQPRHQECCYRYPNRCTKTNQQYHLPIITGLF
jgi:hypothetical protein